jgi:transposase-like protein
VFLEPEGDNVTTEIQPRFQVEAVKLVREAQADPQSAFAGNGQMKPEQHEIEWLRRELARMKAERDILKKPRPTLAGTRYEVRVHRKASKDLAGDVDLRRSMSRAVAFTQANVAKPRVYETGSSSQTRVRV